MEGILKFDLTEEKSEFELAVNAYKWYAVAWDMDQQLRKLTKYASDDTPSEVVKALYNVREDLRQIMLQHGVDFD